MSSHHKISAIVVDDDMQVATTLAEYLKLHDINVVGIGYDGKSAAELYAKLAPDVVFLDLLMPKYDGFYGLKQIRKISSTVNIVMITADVTESSTSKMRELGASTILYKPLKIDEMLCAIRQLAIVEAAA